MTPKHTPPATTTASGSTRPSDQDAERLADQFGAADLNLSRSPAWTDPRLGALIEAVAARAAAEQQVLDAVRVARRDGTPWAMIAAVLGVSHQGAMKRFKPLLASDHEPG